MIGPSEAPVPPGAGDPSAPGRPPQAEPSRRPPPAPSRLAGEAPRRWRAPAGLVVLLSALAAWSGWFVFRSSIWVEGRRVFCLFDDAMISMTYARNLVEGHGLNWARRGAPVEGFTHPLWTAMMVPVQLLPLPLDRRALVVQGVAITILLLHVVAVRRLVLRHFSLPRARHWAPAAVATAFYFPLAFWTLIGMETGLQSLLTTLAVQLALDIVHCRRDRRWALGLTGAAAVLLRLDMLPWVVAVQGYIVLCGRRHSSSGALPASRGDLTPADEPLAAAPRPPVRGAWLPGVGLPVLALLAYGVFRWRYFGELLPNTYYLKLAGVPLAVRLLRGGSVLLDTLRAYGPLLAIVAVGVTPLLAALHRPPAFRAPYDRWAERLALPAGLFVLACGYCVYVGGDAWEGEVSADRFVAFAMPLVFVLANALLNQALDALARRRAASVETSRMQAAPAAHPERGGAAALWARYAVVTATVAMLTVADGLAGRDGGEAGWRRLAVITPPLHADNYEHLLGSLHALQRYADAHAAVAVTWAGTSAYFSDFQMIDQLGYNDRTIAHQPPALALNEDNFNDFVPGHVKWDIDYVLDRQRPDALLGAWGDEPTQDALLAHGFLRLDGIWLNPESPRLHLSPSDIDRLDHGEDYSADGNSDGGDDSAGSAAAGGSGSGG